MTTHDIKRYTISGDIAYPIHEDPEGDYVSYEDHVAAIEADCQRRGEPVACFKCGHPTHRGECVNVAPQPAEPVKVPSDDEIMSIAALHETHGDAWQDAEYRFTEADFLAAAHALLARYGQPAEQVIRNSRNTAEPVAQPVSVTQKWQDGDDSNMVSRVSEPVKVPSDAEIREVFLANGFTIKPGHDDLKPYVYQSARALIARCGARP